MSDRWSRKLVPKYPWELFLAFLITALMVWWSPARAQEPCRVIRGEGVWIFPECKIREINAAQAKAKALVEGLEAARDTARGERDACRVELAVAYEDLASVPPPPEPKALWPWVGAGMAVVAVPVGVCQWADCGAGYTPWLISAAGGVVLGLVAAIYE